LSYPALSKSCPWRPGFHRLFLFAPGKPSPRTDTAP